MNKKLNFTHMKPIKIQNKCFQTVLDASGKLLYYRITYPISLEFKMHLQTEDPDEHDYVISVPIKGKDNTSRYYYSRHSENFNKLKAIQYMIMVKSSNFKMLQEKQKKNMLVQSYSYYESLS